MVLAAFLFASMGVCVKFASSNFNPAELVFYRGVLGMLFLWGLARSTGVRLKTSYPGMHAWRSAIGVTSLGAWFYAIAHLPLATAMTLNYMSSVWVAAFLIGGSLLLWRPGTAGTGLLGACRTWSVESENRPQRGQFLPDLQAHSMAMGQKDGEKWTAAVDLQPTTSKSDRLLAQGPLVLTVMAGFAGVVMMLRPTLDDHQMFAGLIGLMSGLTAAFAYLQVMALSRLGEPETRTVFYFALGSTVAGGLVMLLTGASPWDWQASLWLLPIGILAAGGQLCMTRAYATARTHRSTLVVANLQYSGIVFAAIYSIVLFGDTIPLLGWVGMATIVLSGIAATVLRGRAAPDAPGEEH